ncbi:MAG TPA: DUF1269 domain-containing protein [Chitinophagaceae bacterium]|nr:DUF1269 domain-containing protein [Chitinophagaceae bacterium]
MKKIIVVAFTEETKANEALHKLNELDSLGDITVYDKVLLRKNSNDETEVLSHDSGEGWRTLAGFTFGSLLGVLAGPVGLVIGMFAGTIAGGISEVTHYDFAEDFGNKIKNRITPGTIAIIAEIEEPSPGLVDSFMQPFGGHILRSDSKIDWDTYEQDQIDKIDEEIRSAERELKISIKAERRKVLNLVNYLNEKRAEKIAKIKARLESNRNKLREQVAKLQSKITGPIPKAKRKRIEEKVAQYEGKIAGLNKKLEIINQERENRKVHLEANY